MGCDQADISLMVVRNRFELAHNCHPIVISGLSAAEIDSIRPE